ncbi:TIGR01777 family protein [Hyunsoonleella flava]|uniref:TIGR01777 family protein n=1 Tax=Hyunsoonleella flava TaxID=2527939 RepID=A0A4V2JA10_9FLAO|nr:TIGR01777 family oxidoreductase [Hyunsoonleella flava]TBN01335.1 TIGR01777 family protein [Hyunsoonleella flava]
MKTILIAGGTGFLGKILEDYFSKKEFTVKILTRNPKKENHIFWNAKDIGTWTRALEKIDVLINLTGKSVDCRYTKENKKLIYDSRIDATHLLGLAINLCDNPPKVWINSSTATIYRHSLDKEMCEKNSEVGDDFSMNIAKAWENTFNSIPNPKTRKIILRTSIVLGKKGGALIPLKNLTRFGLGGYQGSGNQKVSWIHELDFARSVDFLIENKQLSGIFNLCVPKPTSNTNLMQALRRALGIPFGINHSKLLLEIGAKIIGTETELILKSRNVIPKKLLENGFNFKYTNIENALLNLIKN